jgi:hypothetical protein
LIIFLHDGNARRSYESLAFPDRPWTLGVGLRICLHAGSWPIILALLVPCVTSATSFDLQRFDVVEAIVVDRMELFCLVLDSVTLRGWTSYTR